MNSTILSITADPVIIKKAQKNADKMGLTLQALLKLMISDVAKIQDADTLKIKTAALRNDLSEEKAMDIIDTVRKELPINK